MSIFNNVVLAWGDILSGDYRRQPHDFVCVCSVMTALFTLLPTLILMLMSFGFGGVFVYKYFIYAAIISSLCPLLYKWIYDLFTNAYKEADKARQKLNE